MRILGLKTRKLTTRALAALETKGLVRRLYPPRSVIATRTKTGAVATFYSSSPRYGAHTFIAVGKRTQDIMLSVHPDNEEFILLNPARLSFKPLYIVVALHKEPILRRKAQQGTLGAKDFTVLEARFNDPATCVFTMCKDTPHCEVTCPGPGQHPVFFVTEPGKLPSYAVRLEGYKLILSR